MIKEEIRKLAAKSFTAGKLSNLVKDVLPFVEDMDVEKLTDRYLLFKLREIYSKNQYLPASFLSDGTIYITALIIALYFDRKPIIIMEEKR